MTSNLLRYAIGLSLTALGVYLGLQPQKLGRIGFGTPGGAVPKEIPSLPRWAGFFIAAELLCVGTGILATALVVHTSSHSVEEFFTFVGAFLFLVTMSVTAIAAGLSAQQLPGFTAKTAFPSEKLSHKRVCVCSGRRYPALPDFSASPASPWLSCLRRRIVELTCKHQNLVNSF